MTRIIKLWPFEKQEMMKYLVLIANTAILLILVAGCSSNPKKDKSDSLDGGNEKSPAIIKLADGLTKASEALKVSDIAEKIEYVKLETTEESILGRGLKVFPIDNGFLIRDNTESLFLFDNNGKFKWKLNNEGRGPAEFVIMPSEIGIDLEQKEIIMPDSKKVHIYDFNGQFKRTLNFPFNSGAAYVLSSGLYLLWNFSPCDINIAEVVDRNGMIVKQYKNYSKETRLDEDGNLPFETGLVMPCGNVAFIGNKDTIWQVNSDLKKEIKIVIDSHFNNFRERYYTYGYNALDSDIFIFYFLKKKCSVGYSIKHKMYYKLREGWAKIPDDIDFGPDVSVRRVGSRLVDVIYPTWLIENKTQIKTGSTLSTFVNGLKEDENPIIRLVTFEKP